MQNTSGNFLAVDTALGATSIAVSEDGDIAASFFEASREDQAALLIARIEGALGEAGVSYSELEAIACCVGPGGFTSIRVGLAALRGLGFAAHIPVVGYSSLHIMAYGTKQSEITAVLPAGREHFFMQHFSGQHETLPHLVEKKNSGILPVAVTTSDEAKAERLLRHDIARNAELMIAMMNEGVPSLSPVPLYVKPPDAVPQQSLLARLSQT